MCSLKAPGKAAGQGRSPGPREMMSPACDHRPSWTGALCPSPHTISLHCAVSPEPSTSPWGVPTLSRQGEPQPHNQHDNDHEKSQRQPRQYVPPRLSVVLTQSKTWACPWHTVSLVRQPSFCYPPSTSSSLLVHNVLREPRMPPKWACPPTILPSQAPSLSNLRFHLL